MVPVLIDFFEPRSRKDTKEHEDLCVTWCTWCLGGSDY